MNAELKARLKADALADIRRKSPELGWKATKAEARKLYRRRRVAVEDAQQAELVCAGAGIKARIEIP